MKRSALRAVVELMWHTGARPGEALRIRMVDIDRSGPVWTYKPASHKTETWAASA